MRGRRILGLAFIATVLLYGVVAHVASGVGEEVSVPSTLVAVVYLVALGALVAGLAIVPRLGLPSGFLIAMALCEVPAILGLILSLLSRSAGDFFVLGGSSILALLYLTLTKYEERGQRAAP